MDTYREYDGQYWNRRRSNGELLCRLHILWLCCKVEKSYTEQNYQRILFLLISDILLNCTDDCMTQAVTATLTYKNANEEDEESRKQAYLKECNGFENFHCTQVRRVQYNIHVHMNVDA